ncbi:MarR family winged helix-turn-helix transcriptional regulator [Aeromicrobium chenweiae]|uniref:MarR family transcriptional regulator n=1 Tax=Aeromicrobium chenweiae TaxID=2079793 RepID=A0A2S0WJP2_9ACTN|nr:MarR family transcriptional regulator [Aeromicrobium chenweiae]AWB91507.1 MarR family transcriptional regulator [Aeromicrobium chenweiae]TGN32342.1 MarR family transcriptional regulator [Aeromicrobium chenweiae]
MTSANRRGAGSPAATELVRELRTFTAEVERYVLQMSHVHAMHRTDLAAIGLVMDRDATSPKDISDGLGLSPSATSAMLDRLERAGHVRRERVETDRRSVRVEITEDALAVGGSMFAILAKHMRQVLDVHDEQELARAAALMHQLTAAARAARDEAAGT